MAKNSCGCGCNSCNNGSSCNSCASRLSSRGCGSLRSLGRSSYTGCSNSGAYSCRNNCNSCNSCSTRNAYTDYPGASTCAGYPLYYTGPCGCRPCNNHNCGHCHHHCCHHCHNNCCNNDCNNNCNNNCCNNDCCESCPCDNCCDTCPCDPCCESCHCNNCHCDECCHCCENSCSAAAEFIVIAPQHEYSGGAFTFASGACRSDGFELCSGGIRIIRPGRYVAVYSFSAPACTNAATTISFSLNGSEMIASRAYVSPAITGDSRAAMGQALFEADAGDIIALNTSTAMNIPASISGGPIATVIIYSVD